MRAAMDRLGGNFNSDEYPIRESADLSFAFEAIVREKPDALIVDSDPLSISEAGRHCCVRCR